MHLGCFANLAHLKLVETLGSWLCVDTNYLLCSAYVLIIHFPRLLARSKLKVFECLARPPNDYWNIHIILIWVVRRSTTTWRFGQWSFTFASMLTWSKVHLSLVQAMQHSTSQWMSQFQMKRYPFVLAWSLKVQFKVRDSLATLMMTFAFG